MLLEKTEEPTPLVFSEDEVVIFKVTWDVFYVPQSQVCILVSWHKKLFKNICILFYAWKFKNVVGKLIFKTKAEFMDVIFLKHIRE